MDKKFGSLLGFARKSGNVILGLDTLEKKPAKAKLIISASDASERTKRNIGFLQRPHIEVEMTKEELGKLLGCGNVAVVGITDENFATQLEKYSETERE